MSHCIFGVHMQSFSVVIQSGFWMTSGIEKLAE
jgi:hypothetical protein